MNGYSKIREFRDTKTRSIDFSDLFSIAQTHKSITVDTSKTQETQQTIDINTKHPNTLEPFPGQEHEDKDGEIFGTILNRSYSVSSTSRRFKAEKHISCSPQSAGKRVFSMRSSSKSDGYSRIHDQISPPFSPTDDDALTNMKTRSKKKRSKILKACKKLFGL